MSVSWKTAMMKLAFKIVPSTNSDKGAALEVRLRNGGAFEGKGLAEIYVPVVDVRANANRPFSSVHNDNPIPMFQVRILQGTLFDGRVQASFALRNER